MCVFLPSLCRARHLASTSDLNGTAGSFFKVAPHFGRGRGRGQTPGATATERSAAGMSPRAFAEGLNLDTSI